MHCARIASWSDEQCNAIFSEMNEIVDVRDLDPIVVPCVRRPPKRYGGQGVAFIASITEQHYRVAQY